MGWLSSKEDNNNEAYAEGYEKGKNASPLEAGLRDLGQAIESNFGEPSSTEHCHNEGWKAGYNSK